MIEIVGYFLLFAAGAFIGSFLYVVSDRVPRGESPLKGRSVCNNCKLSLRAKDLIPLLSFFLTKGRCRYCGEKLSYYYPLSETVTGLSFAGLAYYLDIFSIPNPLVWVTYFYLLIIVSFLLIILFSDMKYKIIPNKVIYPAIIFVVLVMLIGFGIVAISSYKQLSVDPFGKYLLEVGYWHDQMYMMLQRLGITFLSAFAIGVFFWLLIVVTKGKGMGGGDVKLAFFIGLVNGFPLNIVAIVLGFVIGALYSGILMLVKRKSLKDVIPFGPFLILGSALTFVFGQFIFDWYINLL